jgi:hypothetical protein
VVQVIEHLPRKCEALSSNSHTTKKKKGKIIKHGRWTISISFLLQKMM